jgi:hypothetical protein
MSTATQSDAADVVHSREMTGSGGGPPSPKRLANDIMRDGFFAGDTAESIAFFCECENARCYQAVWLTVSEYDRARRDPNWKAVIEEHRTRSAEGDGRALPGTVEEVDG